MAHDDWLWKVERQLRDAGAVPNAAMSKGTHRKWQFPNGAIISIPGHAHHRSEGLGKKRRSTEALVRRAVRVHGRAAVPKPKTPGMRPSDVDTWTPLGPPPERSRMSEPIDEPTPATPTTPVNASTSTPEAPDAHPHRCNYCAVSFKTRGERQSHYQVKHAKPWTCPVCQMVLKQRGRHNHNERTATPATPPSRPKAPVEATPAPAAPESTTTTPAAPYTALRTAELALHGVRGYIAKLEEENKLLKREIAALEHKLDVIEAAFQRPASRPPRL
jgi:hypothetical protein